jgi:hypothetical protein
VLWRRRHAGCHRLTGFCLLLFRENALTGRATHTHCQPCDPDSDTVERDGVVSHLRLRQPGGMVHVGTGELADPAVDQHPAAICVKRIAVFPICSRI